MEVAIVDQRYSNGRQPQMAPFGSSSHCARVDDVITKIGVGIDARHHPIKRRVEQTVNGQVYAICRRSVDRPETIGMLLYRKRPVQCQGVTGTAVIPVRGNNFQLPEALQTLIQRHQTRRMNAIVVGQQNSHNYLR